jgi:hypothetical protein
VGSEVHIKKWETTFLGEVSFVFLLCDIKLRVDCEVYLLQRPGGAVFIEENSGLADHRVRGIVGGF